jgi:hypothetical protein
MGFDDEQKIIEELVKAKGEVSVAIEVLFKE